MDISFRRGHRCDSGSCANEDGQKSQWYQRETSLWRTCSVLSICFIDRHGKGPSREPQPQRFYVYTVASIWYSLYMYLNIYFADMAEG